MKRNIIYATYRLGGRSGAAKSSIDVLYAALLSDLKVIVHTELVSPSVLARLIKYVIKGKLAFRFFRTREKYSLVLKLYLTFQNAIFNLSRYFIREYGEYDILLVNTNLDEVILSSLLKKYKFNRKININRGGVDYYKFSDSLVSGNLNHQINYQSKFDEVVYLSEHISSSWRQAGVNVEAHVIPNTVSRDWSQRNIEKDKNFYELRIAYIGSVQKRKGGDLFLKAIEKYGPGPYEVRFYGEFDIDFKDEFTDLLNQVKLRNNRVEYCGYNDIDSILDWCNVVALTTRGEAMPRTILEAMSARKLIFATSVDAIPEMIVDKRSGILIRELTVDSVYDSFSEMLLNRDSLIILAKQAYEDYQKHYSYNSYLERWKKLFGAKLR